MFSEDNCAPRHNFFSSWCGSFLIYKSLKLRFRETPSVAQQGDGILQPTPVQQNQNYDCEEKNAFKNINVIQVIQYMKPLTHLSLDA